MEQSGIYFFMYGFKEKMKLLLISRHFPNIPGGVSDYTYFLSKALAKNKIDVYVLTSDDERINKDVENVNIFPVIKNWGFKGINEIVEYTDKIKPDWVIVQYVPYMYSYLGIPYWLILLYIILKIKKYKLCTMFHEVRIVIDLARPKYIPVAISQKIIAFFIALFSDKITVNIELWKKFLKPFDKKIKVIPVGSNIIPEKDIKIKKIDKKDKLIIGSFGSASKVRRIDIHLKAVKILKDKGINVRYIFVGNAPLYLKKLAKKLNIDVEFTGYLTKEKVYEYLKSFDFFIFFDKYSNKYEGGINLKSGVVSAAFSAGVSIISNKGILTDKILNGYFIKCKVDKNELAETIIKYLKEPIKLKKIRERTKDFYEENLKWERITQDYLEHLKCQK